MKKILVLILILITSCSGRAALSDFTNNAIVISVTKGEFPDKIVIKWIPTPFYETYQVLRSSTIDGFYAPISPRENMGSFSDTQITEGREYFYRVEAYNKEEIPLFITDVVDGFAGVMGGFFPPENVQATQGASTKRIKLTWDRVIDAEYYEIVRATNPEFTDSEIIAEKVYYLTYTDLDVETASTYYYKITSYDSEGIPSSDRSQTAVGTTFGGELNFSTLAGEYDDKVLLTWNSVEHATFYQIYRSESRYAQGELIAEINPNTTQDPDTDNSDNSETTTIENANTMSYEDKSAKANTSYYYQIIYGHETAQQVSARLRSFLKVLNQPAQVPNFQASQATHPNNITLTWDSVEGATGYELERQKIENNTVLWEVITPDGFNDLTYVDIPPSDRYVHTYRITALNPAPGIVSDTVTGWANRPPANITASTAYGERIEISWLVVPGASSYTIFVSDSEEGPFSTLATEKAESGADSVTYVHIPNIGNSLSGEFYYRVSVNTASGQSQPSETVKGMIQKIQAPKNLVLRNEKTKTRTITLTWDRVENAQKYIIYAATLSHRGVNSSLVQNSDFKKIGEAENAAFEVSFGSSLPLYPIRRHIFMVRAVDPGGAAGVGVQSGETWRLPVDPTDFAKDVDVTIMEAQKRIANFGNNGSGGTVKGRAGGQYTYKAALTGSQNNWQSFASFEVILNGSIAPSVNAGTMSATLNGPLNVSGLYSGTIQYNSLSAKDGGYVTSGGITVTYGGKSETWNTQVSGANLDSVVLQNGEKPSPYPSYEPGVGAP